MRSACVVCGAEHQQLQGGGWVVDTMGTSSVACEEVKSTFPEIVSSWGVVCRLGVRLLRENVFQECRV